MENKIDIKDFAIVKRYKIGEEELEEVKRDLKSKFLDFYALDINNLKDLENIGEEDTVDFVYKVLPCVSNIDMTLTLDEFKKFCGKASKKFWVLVESMFDYAIQLREDYETMEIIKESINKKAEKLKQLYTTEEIQELEKKLDIEPVKTKEEILEELYSELNTVKDDKEKRKEILNRINELEQEE